MPQQEITSAENPLIKDYRRLLHSRRYRRETGRLAVEGVHLLREALAAGLIPETVFFTRGFLEGKGAALAADLPCGVRQAVLPETLFRRLAETETPQAVAAVIPYREPSPSALCRNPLTLVLFLDRLQDPGNMGTLLRTAAAAGAEAVFYTSGSVDPYSPKVLRSTAGAIFHIKPAAVREPLPLLEELRRKGLQIVAAAPRAPVPYWDIDFRKPTVLLIGNESSGLSPGLASAAHISAAIPQKGNLDSLNAAVAASIILYEALRQRH